MPSDLLIIHEKPSAKYLIAGWRRQWSDGGDISSGLTRYLIRKLEAKKIAEMSRTLSDICFPFQISGTHDAYRPRASFENGLPSAPMAWDNSFYDAGNGLIIFRGDEPWYRIDLYGEAFFEALGEIGIEQTVTIEGYNGPAPPDIERRVSCVYSKENMKENLDKFGLQYSSYGKNGGQGPTIGMALINMAHFEHPDVEIFRLGAMAPMYPFATSSNQQVGIPTDHRAFYDIMRRLKVMFNLTIDLSELKTLGDNESDKLKSSLDRIATNNSEAKDIIDKARLDFSYTPFPESTDINPDLDRALQDILGEQPNSTDNPSN